MAKIAVEYERIAPRGVTGSRPGRPASRILAQGDGWSVSDVICNAGPHDHAFEEQHSDVCIAVVIEGSFQYESSAGRELMTPGSLLLGNAGQYFECGHEHGVGDRCIAFAYEPEYFDRLASEAGARGGSARFSPLRVPPVRELSALVARACAGLAGSGERATGREQGTFTTETERLTRNSLSLAGIPDGGMAEWEEIGVELAGRALKMANGGETNRESSPAAEARVTRIVRMIEGRPGAQHGLTALAREAKLSRYHFLRIFRQTTGLTPHQYVLRARLRRAATRLAMEQARVLDIALDSGFGDASNFNHAFRAEFGVSPRSYRESARHSTKRRY
ncbi:MAG TPA: AraC family transcriptional regulator [Candidatus Acidoferrales bacterium]|nr:AraC family transcriptional regulator [Candidatus Acidoferrales bacterium]